jgi:hypothetical protein
MKLTNKNLVLALHASVNATLYFADLRIGSATNPSVEVAANSEATEWFTVTENIQPDLSDSLKITVKLASDCGSCLIPWLACDGETDFFVEADVELDGDAYSTLVRDMVGIVHIEESFNLPCTDIIN